MGSGEMGESFAGFLALIFGLLVQYSRVGSLHYVFMDWRHMAELVTTAIKSYSELINICVWAKSNAGLGSFYRSQHEMVAVLKNGRVRHINNVRLGRAGRYRTNVWQYAGNASNTKARLSELRLHPTVKPVAMIGEAIRDASKPGGLILDPLGGAGTTLIAAEQVGRRAALMELDPKFVDVTLLRFQRATGIEPVLRATGQKLTDVQRQRLENGDA